MMITQPQIVQLVNDNAKYGIRTIACIWLSSQQFSYMAIALAVVKVRQITASSCVELH